MVSETPVTYIQCPSCLRRNHSEMQFCIYCGAGVTPEAEKKRTASPLTWRTCARCGQSDELNQNFCIFCSGKIVVPGEQPDAAAFKKFSWELEQIDANKIMEKAEIAPKPVQPPVKSRAKRKSKSHVTLGLTILLAIFGIVAGGGIAFLVGQTGLQRLVLQSTSWQNKDLVVYTTVHDATIAIEDEKKQVYTLTKTGADGSLSISDLAAGKYTLSISAPGRLTVRQKFPVVENRTTVLGFPNRIDLPRKKD